MSDKKSNNSSNEFDVQKLRVSEHQIENNLREAAEGALKTQTDKKTGKETFWGFKVNRTSAFVINMLYDNVVIPWTDRGAKHIYTAALQLAERHAPEGKAQQIATAVALAARIGGVVIKPVAELISINRDHYKERADLSEKVTNAIAGTPADYSTNEVVKTAYERVHNEWTRDLTRKIPDAIKTGIQVSIAYDQHKVHMSQAAPYMGAGSSNTTEAGKPPLFDSETMALDKRIKEIKSSGLAPETIEMELERLKRSRGLSAAQEDKDLGSKLFSPNLSGMLSGVTEATKAIVSDINEGWASPKTTAWDKIQLLKQVMDEQPAGQNPDRIKVNGILLKKFIVEIFQQNEVDRGRGRMGDALVEQLMPAVNKIADHLADTTLDANALIHLVGDHKIIIHQDAARIFAKEETVEQAILALRGVNTSKEKVNVDEFFSNFADPALAKDVIRKNLDTLQGAERALFISIFPDELLTKAGMNKEGILAARHECHEGLYDIVAANTIELSHSDPEQLKHLGLTKSEIQALHELGSEIKRGDTEAVKVAVDGADRTVISALRTAALHQQLEGKGEAAERIWTDMVQKGATLREKIDSHSENVEAAAKPKSFAEREKKHEPHDAKVAHRTDHKDTKVMTASERELHRRSKHTTEPHHGIGAT